MRKILALAAILLVFSHPSFAEELFSDCILKEFQGFFQNTSFFVGTGYRCDNLKWTFPGFSPGEAIHEKWKGIDMGYLEASCRQLVCQDFLLEFDVDYGWSGWENTHKIELIDYNSSIKTKRTSKAKAQAYDLSAGIGKKLYFELGPNYTLNLSPFIGWGYSHQRFKSRAFYLNGHYFSKYAWNGPWAGFETTYQLCNACRFVFDYAFHYGRFHATIDEFLRSRHKKRTSYGNVFEFKGIYQLCCLSSFALKFNYKDYWTEKKHSVNSAYNGKRHEKRAELRSCSIGADIRLEF